MKHAIVKLGDYNIPLIGIPEHATIDECDLCGDEFYFRDLEFSGKQFLCIKCREQNIQLNET